MNFNEANSVRDLVRDQAVLNKWEFIEGSSLERARDDVLIDSHLRAGLVRLNPDIATDPSRADDVIYRLRTIIQSARAGAILAANEEFAAWLTGERSMPFGKDGEHVTKSSRRKSRLACCPCS